LPLLPSWLLPSALLLLLSALPWLAAPLLASRPRPKRGTVSCSPGTRRGCGTPATPITYMPGPGTTSKSSSISLLFFAGFRLEITPLPFFPKKFFKPKIQPGYRAALGWGMVPADPWPRGQVNLCPLPLGVSVCEPWRACKWH